MTFIRNPNDPFTWDSDGEYTGKFKAQDGTLHDSAQKATEYDRKKSEALALGLLGFVDKEGGVGQ